MGATLHLVSACPMPTVAMGPEMVVVPDHGEVVDSTKADLERMAADLRRQGLSVEIHTPVGDAADALCAVAETVEADLIVVGNKRMQGAARLLGSVPNRVAHKADLQRPDRPHRLTPHASRPGSGGRRRRRRP